MAQLTAIGPECGDFASEWLLNEVYAVRFRVGQRVIRIVPQK